MPGSDDTTRSAQRNPLFDDLFALEPLVREIGRGARASLDLAMADEADRASRLFVAGQLERLTGELSAHWRALFEKAGGVG